MEKWLNESLNQTYTRVKVLKRTEKSEISVWIHNELQQKIVKRVFKGEKSVYQTLLTLQHPNLPRIYQMFEEQGKVTVLEEYIDGVTVAEVLETGLYSQNGVRKVGAALCDALTILHANGIVHRDIKPENIMITRENRIVLIDFDAARTFKQGKAKDTVALGTAGYAAPEQFDISQSDCRTDIYAMGILMNVMLTGEHPSKSAVKGHMGRVIRKCINVLPSKRYANAKALKRAILY
ncbi:serine/threonine-protein kinase [Eubacterium sp. 1001713B170207_170306_E7]|uniref:serine/threonine-protein kinase n=1 Tax=Eubacterium sp. 1001713B170207_170306_E7 TaxID=2787097 RepID=UPI0018978A07|nr:serine/threonine-protein kinase [Eubacterium sp. 1001713B170207_170306_E7]